VPLKNYSGHDQQYEVNNDYRHFTFYTQHEIQNVSSLCNGTNSNVKKVNKRLPTSSWNKFGFPGKILETFQLMEQVSTFHEQQNVFTVSINALTETKYIIIK